MNRPAPLTDRAALLRNRRRAAHAPVSFLHEIAADELKDRLGMVNKGFNKPVIVSGQGDFWHNVIPNAPVIADDDTLMLEAGAHDLVIHAMALHWANDPVGQLIQSRHALRPDGLFLGVLFGGQTLAELRASIAQAEADVVGGLSPRVAPMAEIRDLGGLLQRAGFALPVADSVAIRASYETLSDLIRDLRGMGETNALNGRLKRPTRRRVFERAAEIYADAYAEEGGRLAATFELIFLLGWAPDPEQPQPLRPGSAQTRLAEALNVKENPLKD
ncbi:SAM-dependent methyltransferase [Aquicoccus porphyridii]|uniref:SAM-dependent methyltransferase n=1 Tax=Aquicoccus porphyridii TaxID=1852029 RepID=A0A5A9Z597_9RHOB|nr:SAM-dependent methyltransferase [Aquicoccus porphyridii]KAA0912298.1 SAM-dependent methyltransferase [Aquicoccus porphyridii]RAI54211.1 SAM-dependent methyltransferase [Rhodobacteraceae bacterium AsT-22]